MMWGLGLSVLTGPLMLALVEAGMLKGFRSGVSVGTGIWISDFLFILAMIIILPDIQILDVNPMIAKGIGFIGVAILIFLAIRSILRSQHDNFEEKDTPNKKLEKAKPFMKGFLLNTLNPFTLLFWISVPGYYRIDEQLDRVQLIILSLSIMFIVILFDVLKVVLARKLQKKYFMNSLKYIRIVSGVLFLVFAVVLLVRVLGRW